MAAEVSEYDRDAEMIEVSVGLFIASMMLEEGNERMYLEHLRRAPGSPHEPDSGRGDARSLDLTSSPKEDQDRTKRPSDCSHMVGVISRRS